jgi:hypothetical protein
MKTAHLAFGLLGLVAFVLTGQYMHWQFDHLHGMADGPRMMFRTAHIYGLWAALLNLVLGLYLVPLRGKLPRLTQNAGSAAILACLICVTISFFTESQNSELRRAWTAIGLYLALAGGVLHGAAVLLERRAG